MTGENGVNSDPEWIMVGLVKRAHGTRGEMLVMSLTDVPGRFAEGHRLYLARKRTDERREVTVESSRESDRGPLVKLAGVETREAAQELFGASLFIPAGEIGEPGPGRFYTHEIEGCEVYEEDRLVGTVTRLSESSKANPYIEIEESASGKTILIPFVRQAILSIDVGNRRIQIAGGFAV